MLSYRDGELRWTKLDSELGRGGGGGGGRDEDHLCPNLWSVGGIMLTAERSA